LQCIGMEVLLVPPFGFQSLSGMFHSSKAFGLAPAKTIVRLEKAPLQIAKDCCDWSLEWFLGSGHNQFS
ncbi:MAG: hypothetical protein ABL921_34975, partial [Pirellula sp.]